MNFKRRGLAHACSARTCRAGVSHGRARKEELVALFQEKNILMVLSTVKDGSFQRGEIKIGLKIVVASTSRLSLQLRDILLRIKSLDVEEFRSIN